MNEQFSLTLIIDNHPGVLSRVAGLFYKRGYNVDFLSSGALKDQRYFIMYIVISGDNYVQDQIVKQLNKLEDVHKVELFEFALPADQ
jgi:acetolactate synthase I/III small subunit